MSEPIRVVPLVSPPPRTPGVEGPPALPQPAAVVFRPPVSHNSPVMTHRPAPGNHSSLGGGPAGQSPGDGKAS